MRKGEVVMRGTFGRGWGQWRGFERMIDKMLGSVAFTVPIIQIAFTVIVTAFIGGVIGNYLTRFFERARLRIAVTNLDFTGSLIEVSNDLIRLTQDDKWGSSLDKFTDYAAIRERELKVSEMISEIEHAELLLNVWITKFSHKSAGKSLQHVDVATNPYFQTNLVGSSIIGALRRREFSELPSSLTEVESRDQLIEIEERSDKLWVLHLGSSGIKFDFEHQNFTDNEKNRFKLLAKSFARGDLPNILAALCFVQTEFKSELVTLFRLRDEIRKHLVHQSRVKVSVTLSNYGKRLIEVDSACSVFFTAGSLSDTTFAKLAEADKQAKSSEQSDPISKLMALGSTTKATSRRFVVSPYLSGADSTRFILVPSGSQIEAVVISDSKIGDFNDISNAFYSSFENGMVECSVRLLTVDEKVHQSRSVSFGKKLAQTKIRLLS